MSDSTFFDELAEQWDDTRREDNKKITQLIQLTGLNQGDRVLDAGCGTGILIPFLKNAVGPAGCITALDYSPKMIAKAKGKFSGIEGIVFVVSDIMQHTTEFCYDSVICLNFFPHVQDQPRFFRRVRELLRVGGSLIIMHDRSRQAVNGVHQSCTAVQNDLLPPGEILKDRLVDSRYGVEMVIDGNDRYFIKAIRL